jgi:hypothetical protein
MYHAAHARATDYIHGGRHTHTSIQTSRHLPAHKRRTRKSRNENVLYRQAIHTVPKRRKIRRVYKAELMISSTRADNPAFSGDRSDAVECMSASADQQESCDIWQDDRILGCSSGALKLPPFLLSI